MCPSLLKIFLRPFSPSGVKKETCLRQPREKKNFLSFPDLFFPPDRRNTGEGSEEEEDGETKGGTRGEAKQEQSNSENSAGPMKKDTYSLSFAAGGQVRAHLNRISNDGHYSISFFNNHITVYSVTSRLAIRSFHSLEPLVFDDIVDTFLSPVNPNLVYILSGRSEEGFHLTILNWYDNVKNPVVSSIRLELPAQATEFLRIINFNSNNETLPNLLVKNQKHSYSIVSYDLNTSAVSKVIKNIDNVAFYALSPNRKNMAFAMKKKSSAFKVLTFDDDNDSKLAYYSVNYSNNKYTPVNLAISNDQANPLLAFGTASGAIVLLFELSSQTPPQRILKWHIGAPKTLTFNPDSTYLLSGGAEKVLVFWNILNEKQQFLPRLNGIIENIFFNSSVPSLIGLSLNVIDGDIQYLILGTTDLLSKLDISTPHLFSGMNKDNYLKKNLLKDLHSFEKSKQFTRFKHPYRLDFRIHPKSNHLYLPSGRHLQVFDSLHNLQVDNIAVAPAIQQYGKVGAENKIQDPMVIGSEFIFCSKTNDKDWLVTCDAEIRGEAEDLTDDSIEHWETLRFWKFSGSTDSWTLQTKMLRPHGDYPITNIAPAPESFFGGEAVLTADSRGNVRLWRPNSQGIWSLRKFYSSGSENAMNNSDTEIKKNKPLVNIANKEGTTCAWSPDSSMIAVGREGKVVLLDVNSFEAIHTISPAISASRFHSHASIGEPEEGEKNAGSPGLPIHSKTRCIDLNLQDSHIISVNFTSNGKLLIVETRSHLTVIDILKNTTVFGLILGGGNNSGFGGSLIKVTPRKKSEISVGDSTDLENDTTDELLIIGKYFTEEKKVFSKITLWNVSDKKSTITCKWCHLHDAAILGAEWSETWQEWILADMNSNFGELGFGKSSARKSLTKESENKQTDNWIVSSLLDNARIVNRAATAAKDRVNLQLDGTEEFNDRQGLQGNAFDGILDHLEGISVETLFDRVLRVV